MIDEGENYLVGGLIEYAGEAEYHHRPRVGKHLLEQGAVEFPSSLSHFAYKGKCDERGAYQVDEEGIAFVGCEAGECYDVEGDVECYECQFQRGKLDGAALKTQIGEWHRLEGIECHSDCHKGYKLGMFGIAEGLRDGCECSEHHGEKQRRHYAHKGERGAKHLATVVPFLIGEAEECGLHAEDEQHQHHCHIGIDVGDSAVATRGGCEFVRVERHQQIVEKSAYYAAQPIYCGVLDK